MFRGLFLRYLQDAFDAGELKFFAAHRDLREARRISGLLEAGLER